MIKAQFLLPFIKYIEKDVITELLNSVSTVFKAQFYYLS